MNRRATFQVTSYDIYSNRYTLEGLDFIVIIRKVGRPHFKHFVMRHAVYVCAISDFAYAGLFCTSLGNTKSVRRTISRIWRVSVQRSIFCRSHIPGSEVARTRVAVPGALEATHSLPILRSPMSFVYVPALLLNFIALWCRSLLSMRVC